MPAKKKASKKSKRSRSGAQKVRIHGDDDLVVPLTERTNGAARRQPCYINSETKEEREKRLAKRKALTLKAARIAYENHHQRKAS